MTYLIEFTPEAVEHLAELTAGQKSSVLEAIAQPEADEAQPAGALGTSGRERPRILRGRG